MKEIKVGIIMNGVTGRMGTNQHLMRSIVQIIKQGGVAVSADEVIMPDPVLVGRDIHKLEKLAALSGIKKITTSVDEARPMPAIAFISMLKPRAGVPRPFVKQLRPANIFIVKSLLL